MRSQPIANRRRRCEKLNQAPRIFTNAACSRLSFRAHRRNSTSITASRTETGHVLFSVENDRGATLGDDQFLGRVFFGTSSSCSRVATGSYRYLDGDELCGRKRRL